MTDTPGPATRYAAITRAVDKLIADHTENDPTVVAVLIARATLVGIKARSGSKRAYDVATALADEFLNEVIR